MNNLLNEMGISNEVIELSNSILSDLSERFKKIDDTAFYNEMKVLRAMQKNKVSEACFNTTTGYGYNDIGRDTLEKAMTRRTSVTSV